MVCEDGETVPPVTELEILTLKLAEPLGLLHVTCKVPLPVQVTCTWGQGVPLLLPENVPAPVMDQLMNVLLFQLPAMV